MTLPKTHSTHIVLREEGDVLIVSFRSRTLNEEEHIDEIGNDLFSLVDSFGYRKLVIDLTGVELATSAFLGKVITLHRKLHRAGGMLVVCSYSGGVAVAMETSKLSEYFHTAADADAAIKLFS